MLIFNLLPFGKTTVYTCRPQSVSGGYKRPSESRIPLNVPVSWLRYFKPQAPGNWADNVVNKSVPSSSLGTSIASLVSSSATWMYWLMVPCKKERQFLKISTYKRIVFNLPSSPGTAYKEDGCCCSRRDLWENSYFFIFCLLIRNIYFKKNESLYFVFKTN